MRKLFFLLLLIPGASFAQQKVASESACILIKQPLDCAFIAHHARKILRGDDNCVLRLLDKIYNKLTSSQDVNLLIALDSLANQSDGYVSDYLTDVGVNLFYHDLVLVAGYFHRKAISSSHSLETFIVEGLSMNVSLSKQPDKEKEKITAFVNHQKQTSALSTENYLYVMGLVKKVDPKRVE